MKKYKYILLLIAVISVAIIVFRGTSKSDNNVKCKVIRGNMEVLVYTSGELESENSENITIPEKLKNRDLRIYEIKITDLVEEGTLVDSGDYVGTLDRTQIEERVAKAQDELVVLEGGYEDAQMDSTLNVSNGQDAIVDAQSQVEEKQIVLKESVYESPAVIRKTQMDLDRSQRQLEQAKGALEMRIKQEAATLNRKKIELSQKRQIIADLKELQQSLTIRAPKKGMVIYAKDNMGAKIEVGTSVSPWMPVIATLPDMSHMISRTYVNEIDISKIHKKQMVHLSVDAFSDKHLNGQVTEVANIGQALPNGNVKVFEVVVKIDGSDADLKPGMTTSNVIHTGQVQDTLLIPLDAVFKNDSVSYVYLEYKGHLVHQIVDLGSENENYIVAQQGLKEGDVLQLNAPDNEANIPWQGWDIYEQQQKAKNRK